MLERCGLGQSQAPQRELGRAHRQPREPRLTAQPPAVDRAALPRIPWLPQTQEQQTMLPLTGTVLTACFAVSQLSRWSLALGHFWVKDPPSCFLDCEAYKNPKRPCYPTGSGTTAWQCRCRPFTGRAVSSKAPARALRLGGSQNNWVKAPKPGPFSASKSPSSPGCELSRGV